MDMDMEYNLFPINEMSSMDPVQQMEKRLES